MRIRMVERTAEARRIAAARALPERIPVNRRRAARVDDRADKRFERLTEPRGRVEDLDQVREVAPHAREVVHHVPLERTDAATDPRNLKLNELHAAIPGERPQTERLQYRGRHGSDLEIGDPAAGSAIAENKGALHEMGERLSTSGKNRSGTGVPHA